MIVKAKSIYGSPHRFLEVEDGRIVRLFTDEGAKADYEFNGHVYPAFTDTHMHFIGYGMLLSELSLDAAADIPEAMRMLADYLPSCNKPIVTGRNWNQDLFAERRMLTREDLDSVSDGRPVVLRRVCGHVAVLNTAALRHYGILTPEGTAQSMLDRYPDQIDRTAAGLPTGVLRENALELLTHEYSDAELTDFILRAQDRLLAYGVAAVHSDDLYFRKDPGEIQRLYNRLEERGSLHIRVYQQSQFGSIGAIRAALEGGYRQDRSGSLALFKNGPLKILADGSLGGRTACLKEPYRDDPSTRGLLIYPQDELEAMLELAASYDVDTVVHAIGDRTVQILIDKQTRLREQNADCVQAAKRRDAIVHCQIMSGEQIESMARIGYHALVQPVFLGYDSRIVRDRVGETLARTSYAYRSMLDAGIRLGFGSDAPVEDPDPFRSLYHAVEAPLYPDEAIRVDEAIAAFTSEAAFFAYEENTRGKLAPGYAADFCVLDRIIGSPIRDNRVIATFVGGALRYKNTRPEIRSGEGDA